jgi:hypothetical protein
MKEKLKSILVGLELGLGSKDAIDELVKIVFQYYGKNTMALFMRLKQLEDDKQREENRKVWSAMELTAGFFSGVAQYLLEEPNSKRAKNLAKEVFLSENLAYTIPFCAQYYPDGKRSGGSSASVWWYDKVVDIIRKNKDRYLPGGESHDWAVDNEWYDYILLLIKENEL